MATHQITGQAVSRIKTKATWAGSGIARAFVMNNQPIPVPGPEDYGGTNWADMCKATVQNKGNNIIGKSFHYIESWNTEGGQKCYPATVTSIVAVSCGGAGGTGIAVNLTYKDNKGQVWISTGVIYQGYGQKYLFPSFHVVDHNNQLAPPVSARLNYIPPGAVYSPPPDPLAAPSDGYTGCTSISATGLNNGVPTWVCWCNGEYTWSAPVQITDTLDTITKAHGGCDIIIPPVDDAFHPSLNSSSWERNVGEQYGFEAGHVSHAYHGIRATIGVSPISGLSNISRTVLQFNGSTLFASFNSYVFSYIKMHFNDDTNRYLGIYQSYNNTVKLIYFSNVQYTGGDLQETVRTDSPAAANILYTRNLSPTLGKATYATLELDDVYSLTYIPIDASLNGVIFSPAGQTDGDVVGAGNSANDGARWVEVGVIMNKAWPDNFTVNNHDFLDMYYMIDSVNGLLTHWDIGLEDIYDALHQNKTRLRHNETYLGKPVMCVDEISNNGRRITANYNRCNCTC